MQSDRYVSNGNKLLVICDSLVNYKMHKVIIIENGITWITDVVQWCVKVKKNVHKLRVAYDDVPKILQIVMIKKMKSYSGK